MVALLTETLDAPWLARVKKVESETIRLLVWLEGGYNSKWKIARTKVGRMVD